MSAVAGSAHPLNCCEQLSSSATTAAVGGGHIDVVQLGKTFLWASVEWDVASIGLDVRPGDSATTIRVCPTAALDNEFTTVAVDAA
jgi:hypothetical protein